MFIQLFSNYLVGQSVLTAEQRSLLQAEIQKTRVKLGTIAVAEGLLTEEQTEKINYMQTQQDRRFGDIAVDLGYMTDEQVSELLEKQGNPAMKLLQILTDSLGLPLEATTEHLAAFQKENGFTDEEFEALKNDDFDIIVPLFTPVENDYVRDMAGLVVRNLTRFVTNNFYFDRMDKVTDYSYSVLSGQKSLGDSFLYLGFGAPKGLDGIIKLAQNYARATTVSGSDAVYDAVCEFASLNNGLFVSVLSDDDINIDMAPPEVFLSQKLAGDAYCMPIYIEGSRVDMIISTDPAFSPGENAHTLNLKRANLNADNAGSLPTVLVVDDSALTRKILIKLLNENGFNVVGEAENGEEGVEMYKDLEPDFVTLDIVMPVMDGVEALKQIKEYDPEAMVAMVSSSGQKDKLMDALKNGAELFFTKPFNAQEIVRELKNSYAEKEVAAD